MDPTQRTSSVVAGVARRLRRHFVIRPGTVIAFLALSVALSGVAYAANTVGSPDIIDDAILSQDLKNGAAVAGVDVVDNSLTGVDINERTLNGVGRKLYFDVPYPSTTPLTTIATVGGYDIKASCENDTFTGFLMRVVVNGPEGDYQGYVHRWSRDGTEETTIDRARFGPIEKGEDTELTFVQVSVSHGRGHVSATFMIHAGPTILELELEATADAQVIGKEHCYLYGVATRAA